MKFNLKVSLGLVLELLFPHLIISSASSSFLDMTGSMPGVEKIGSTYYSPLCMSKPVRLLDSEYTDANNIRECILNSTAKCLSKEAVHLNASESQKLPRRSLLKRIPLKGRKRRGVGWLKGHPNDKDIEIIQKFVLTSENNCFFLSKECLKYGLTNKDLVEYEGVIPRLERRTWGSCALIGLSDNMLFHEYGKDIDSHDVVIRMGHLSLDKYKKHVGSKSDIVIYRPRALKRDNKSHRPLDVKVYLCKNPITAKLRRTSSNKKLSFSTMRNSADIYCDTTNGKNDHAGHLLRALYASMSPRKKPTTGTLYALRLAFSRLCNRLDIYGISSGGGGTYFEPNALTKKKHGTELDSWLLHFLMKNYESELKTCIYA